MCSISNFILVCFYTYYHAVVAFYDEYEYLNLRMKVPLYAKSSTFSTAYEQVKKDKAKQDIFVRLSAAKGKQGYYSFSFHMNASVNSMACSNLSGSFDKCDICHNADRLLSSRSIWSESERKILQAYRREHIARQFEERIKLQQNIADTYKLDENGRPMSALIFGDGMTVFTGRHYYDI